MTHVRVLAAGLIVCIVAGAARAEVSDKIDWPGFMARQDMIWTRLPASWNEGAFLGNGELGGMIFADEGAWHMRIGRSDVVFAGNRMPIGDLYLRTVGKITGSSMRLELWNAEASGKVKTTAGEIQFRTFTHASQMVQIIELRPTTGEKECTLQWRSQAALDPRAVMKKQAIPANQTNPPARMVDAAGVHLAIQDFKSGGGDVTAWKEIAGADSSKLFLLSVGYSATSIDDATRQATESVATAASTGLDALAQSHRDWWHHYYQESFLSIPDSRLEAFYWAQMYKLASATRADRPAIDLMGPWFDKTPWPKIWWNLNIQLTYWPVLTSNRLELGESLCRMLDAGADQLAKNAGEYSSDSAGIGRSSSYDCRSAVGNELCNLPWTMHNYYLQYRYSMDEAMLRDRIFPLLKRSINYYLHVLAKGPDGKLHLTRGFSPEYPDQPTPNPDCNIDLALLRWGCLTLLDTCQRLRIDDPLIPTWRDTLANLTPYPTDANGLRISASMPFAVSHRHYSHLLMVYPLYIMNWDQPENRDLISRTLAHWQSMPKALQGYSFSGAASISAMMGRGDDAARFLNHLLDIKIHPNTMYTETGPVIETPLSAAASIHDMLLSSWGDKIRVFPAVPQSWRDVTFQNLRAQGAFLVSAVRRDGQTRFVRIESLAGEPCKVWTDMSDSMADGNVTIRTVGDGVVEIPLKKGESIILHPRGQKPDLTISGVAQHIGSPNFYGMGKN